MNGWRGFRNLQINKPPHASLKCNLPSLDLLQSAPAAGDAALSKDFADLCKRSIQKSL